MCIRDSSSSSSSIWRRMSTKHLTTVLFTSSSPDRLSDTDFILAKLQLLRLQTTATCYQLKFQNDRVSNQLLNTRCRVVAPCAEALSHFNNTKRTQLYNRNNDLLIQFLKIWGRSYNTCCRKTKWFPSGKILYRYCVLLETALWEGCQLWNGFVSNIYWCG